MTFVLYDESRQEEAIALVKDFRQNGKHVELAKKAIDKAIREYVSYAKRNLCVSMMYLKQNGEIEMVNLITGKAKIVTKNIK